MATFPIGGQQRAWAPGPTGPAADPGASLIARAARHGDGSNPPPSREELKTVDRDLLRLARKQGLERAPTLGTEDRRRLVELDRALQRAKEANLAKAGPEWLGDLRMVGPRAVNALMDTIADGLKAKLVHAAARLEQACPRAVLPANEYVNGLRTDLERVGLEIETLTVKLRKR